VLFMGDSFTHARTWADRTIAALRDRGMDAVGFEAGVSGYGTTQEFMLLSRLLPLLKPDVVVLQFYAWNDMRDNWAFPGVCYNPRMTLRPSMRIDGVIEEPSSFWIGVRGFELWKQLLEPTLDPFRVSRASSLVTEVGLDGIAAQRLSTTMDYHLEESWAPFYRPSQQQGAFVNGAWQITAVALESIRDLCAASNTPLVVIALDNPFTLDVDVAEQSLKGDSTQGSDWDADLPLRRLAAVLGELGVPLIDLTPHLRKRRDHLGGVKLFDGQGLSGHLLPESEEVPAELLAPVLDSMARDAQRRR